jgi:uncharacterized membrane protein YbhN (UPF0104 family)
MGRLPAGFLARPRVGQALEFIRASEAKILAYCRRRGRILLQVLLFFLLVWAVSLGEMRLVLHFLKVQVSLAQTLLILAGGKFAFLLPFPGALGVLELTYVGVFELLDLGAETGLSLVLYMRARDLLFAVAGLIAALAGWRGGKPVSS